MTIETVAFDPDKYFQSTAAQAHLIADAMKSGDAGYISDANGIVARQGARVGANLGCPLQGTQSSRRGTPASRRFGGVGRSSRNRRWLHAVAGRITGSLTIPGAPVSEHKVNK